MQWFKSALVVSSAMLAVAMAASTNGCSSSPAKGDGGTDAKSDSIVKPDGNGGPDGQTMQAMVAQFNKQNPGIQVTMQTIGSWTTFYSKLLPALTAERLYTSGSMSRRRIPISIQSKGQIRWPVKMPEL